MLREICYREKVLTVAVATDDVRALECDASPKGFGNLAERLIARELIFSGRTNHLGDLGVGVKAIQPVLAAGERLEYLGVVEGIGELEVFRVAGECIQVGQDLVHPTELVFK